MTRTATIRKSSSGPVCPGVFFLRLFSFPAAPNSTINYAGGEDYAYRLSLTTGPFIDHTIPQADGSIRGVGWNLTADDDPASCPGVHLLRPAHVVTDSVTPFSTDSKLSMDRRYIGVLDDARSVAAQFAVTKGTAYRMRIRAQHIGSLLDPVLSIQNAQGANPQRE